jgi:YebC/PmpR family DNA-binding regulatory protein
MSGHNKWSKIEHKKGVNDARKGKLFSVFSKEITVATRSGGGDVNFNMRLRTAVDKAKAANMPADNITRAIQKGTGEIPGVIYEEFIYEGYGPAGAGVIVEVTTDNKNRSASDVRSTFTKHGGNMAGAGAVAFNFQRKGQIIIARDAIAEDKLMELVLNAGADDLQTFETHYEVLTTPNAYAGVADALSKAKIPAASSEIAFLPTTTVPLSDADKAKLKVLTEALEALDDVQYVWTNEEE